MSTTFTTPVEISQPTLNSATSSRVKSTSFTGQQPVLRSTSITGQQPVIRSTSITGQQPVYSFTAELIKRQSLRKSQPEQPNDQDTPASLIQTKYASPENTFVQNMTRLSITTIESNGVNGKTQTNGCSGPAFSDTSSELSDTSVLPPLSETSNNTINPIVLENTDNTNIAPDPVPAVPPPTRLTDEDINQVVVFYRSHKTEVRVCRSLANLYVSVPKIKDRNSIALSSSLPEKEKVEPKRRSGKKKSLSFSEPTKEYAPPVRELEPADIRKDEWEFAKTGIPLLVLDSGEHHRERKLSIVLAERGTGFMLWSDTINHLTKYNTPHDNFHTLTLSTDSTRLVGLSFDEASAAEEFAESVQSLTANPDDDLLNLSKKKKKKKEKKPKYKPPKKIEISQPCCFVHVTKLERPDILGIPLLVFPPPPSGAELQQNGSPVSRAMSQSSGISDCSTVPSTGH